MFKSWSKKNKIKAVFSLQFQATEVPKLKKSALMISLVPDDVGKPTVKLEKAAIEDGTCVWQNPVYETVRLVREAKTGKINEKIYHFVVATGSSKSGFLGEASVDFADFEAETEPITVSLPLKFANSGAILHVTIQRVDGDTDQRDGEANGTPTLHNHDRSFNSQLSFSSSDGNHNFEQVHLHKSSSENAEQNGGSTAKQSSMPKKGMVNGNATKSNTHRRTNTDWSLGSVSDGSFADSINSLEDNPSRDRSQEVRMDSIEKLKNENALLTRQVEVSELELQTLRKQVAKETKEGHNLSRQIINLTEERDALRTECKQLKFLKKCQDEEADSKMQSEVRDARTRLEDMRGELNHEKELRNDIQLQLQKTHESNSKLILAVRDLEEMIGIKNKVIADLSSDIETLKNAEENQDHVQGGDDIKEVDPLRQKITDLNDEMNTNIKQQEELEMYISQLELDNELLKKENDGISKKLDEYKIQEIINKKECSSSLAVIKELESQVERLEGRIRKQAEEFSESLTSINELESLVKGLEKELEEQAQGFENDLDAMKHAKAEQEERAIRAEEALRNTRWKNAVTVERLQDEFKNLTVEMSSKFDDNDKTTTQAVADADDLRLQKRVVEEKLQKSNERLSLIQDQSEAKIQELSYQLNSKAKQIEQMARELDSKSKQLENTEKHEHFNTVPDETATLVERWNSERDDLEKKVASSSKEAEKARQELISMISLKDQKDMVITNLLSEVEDLRIQCKELKLKKENSRKQESQLKDDTQNQDNAASHERIKLLEEEIKLKEAAQETTTTSFLAKEKELYNKIKQLERKVGTFSDRKMEMSNSYTSSESNVSDLLTEVSSLKESNKVMERELKEMEERYSEISLKFAEVEGERQQLVMTVRNLKNYRKN